MSFPAIFAITIGFGMIGQWLYSYIKHQIPELETESLRIKFHIAAEIATALALIAGGCGLLTNQPWKFVVFLIAMGMLLYTVIVSPGYFAQKNQWGVVGMFGVILVLAIYSITLVVRNGLLIG